MGRIFKFVFCYVAFVYVCSAHSNSDRDNNAAFPEYFKFGTATSSYQIEGAWNEDGKGESIWDRMVHSDPSSILDGTNADVGANSYHLYQKDVDALQFLGVDFYRFSISWPRVLPNGDVSTINEKGVEYYSKLIDRLLDKGIMPMVTLFHWDLPQPLQDLGGLLNPLIVNYYVEYARLMFSRLGHKVRYWITFNEPFVNCIFGFSTAIHAPRVNATGVGEYLCGHHILLAHAAAYRLYQAEFQDKQNGQVGITMVSHWFYPKNNSAEDVESVGRAAQFMLGWFTHPIFSQAGGYPPIMREIIDTHSRLEGRAWSRLPVMDDATIDLVKGSSDFLGLNHYTAVLVDSQPSGPVPSWLHDNEVTFSVHPEWPSGKSPFMKVVPESIGDLLRWVRDEYANPIVIITENGYSDLGQMQDYDRVHYLCSHLKEVMRAVTSDKCNVIGYTHWSLIDNFEWSQGYDDYFGLFSVNVTDPNLERKPKLSANIYKKIIASKRFPLECEQFKHFPGRTPGI